MRDCTRNRFICGKRSFRHTSRWLNEIKNIRILTYTANEREAKKIGIDFIHVMSGAAARTESDYLPTQFVSDCSTNTVLITLVSHT